MFGCRRSFLPMPWLVASMIVLCVNEFLIKAALSVTYIIAFDILIVILNNSSLWTNVKTCSLSWFCTGLFFLKSEHSFKKQEYSFFYISSFISHTVGNRTKADFHLSQYHKNRSSVYLYIISLENDSLYLMQFLDFLVLAHFTYV